MKFIKDNWFFVVIVVLFGSNILQFISPKVVTKEVIKRDTVETVRIDSISLLRKDAEIKYLRSQIVTSKGKIKYITKCDTIAISDTTYIVPNFVASWDTTFSSQLIKIKYFYPQNQFDFTHRYLIKDITIKETREIQVKPFFEMSHGILFGAFVNPKGEVNLGVGYGFKIGINY